MLDTQVQNWPWWQNLMQWRSNSRWLCTEAQLTELNGRTFILVLARIAAAECFGWRKKKPKGRLIPPILKVNHFLWFTFNMGRPFHYFPRSLCWSDEQHARHLLKRIPSGLICGGFVSLAHLSDYRHILCDNGLIFLSMLNLLRWKLRLIGVWLFVPAEGFFFRGENWCCHPGNIVIVQIGLMAHSRAQDFGRNACVSFTCWEREGGCCWGLDLKGCVGCVCCINCQTTFELVWDLMLNNPSKSEHNFHLVGNILHFALCSPI